VPPGPTPEHPSRGRLVLVVEDEALIAMDLERLLGRHGWRVLGPVAERLRALGVPFVVADRPVPNLGATDPRTSTRR
jgi:hypothetical protein